MHKSKKIFYLIPKLNSNSDGSVKIIGCYSCFTKCSLVKGKCFSEDDDREKCDIWKNRKKDPSFYYGAHWHGIHPLAFNIRTSIMFIQDKKENGDSKESIVEYIEKYIPRLASYLIYYIKELGECPVNEFDMKRMSKITKYYTGKKFSNFRLPEYPAVYINKMMKLYEKQMKEKPSSYSKKYKTTRLPVDTDEEDNSIPKKKKKRKEV